MDNDCHQYLGNAQHLRNLRIAESFQEAQREDLRRPRLKLSQRPAQRLPQLWHTIACLALRHLIGQIGEFDGWIGLSPSHHIQRCVDSRPPQVTFLILDDVFYRIGARSPAGEPQKNCLQHVLRIRGVARNPVGRAEHQTVVSPKSSFEFVRDRDLRLLRQYALQGTPPVTLFHN